MESTLSMFPVKFSYYSFLQSRFHDIEDFLFLLTDGINKREEEFYQKIERVKEQDPPDIEDWIENLAEDFFPYHELNEQFAYHSIITLLYSLVEDCMNQICSTEFKKSARKFSAGDSSEILRIKLTDLKGTGIDRAKSYLTKVIGLEYKFDTVEWNKIKVMQKIRNSIVHNDTILKEHDLKDAIIIRYFEDEVLSISPISKKKRVSVTKEYIEEMLEVAKLFIHELIEAT